MRTDAYQRRSRWRRRLAGTLLCCWIMMPSTDSAADTPDASGQPRPGTEKKDPKPEVGPRAKAAPEARAKTGAKPTVKVAPAVKVVPAVKVAPKAKAAPKAEATPAAVTATTVAATAPAAPASAGDGSTSATEVKKAVTPKKKLKPWRGSQFVYSNTFSVVSLAPRAELTYNPTYMMIFKFRPRWWFNRIFYVRANLNVVREVTQHDGTTYKGEAWLGDLSLIAGAAKLYTIPKAKIDISADLALTFPTSKASQGATLAMAIGPNVRIARSFKVLKGLTFGGNLRVTPYFHRYTTRGTREPYITCGPREANCDAYQNMGGRNAKVRLSTSLDADLTILKWMGVSLSYGWFVDWLRPLSGDEGYEVYQPMAAENERYLSYFGASVYFIPLKPLMVSVNYETYSPQLAPDSTYYNPFGNRHTTITLDLILRVDGLIAMFGGN